MGGGVLNGGVSAMDPPMVPPWVTVLAAGGGVAEGSAIGLGVGVGLLWGPAADLGGGVSKPDAGVGVMGVDSKLT